MEQRAHHTSARFNRDQSEFDECGFESVTIDGTPAPFVSESPLKIGLTLQDHQPLAINGTHLIIGSVEQLSFANDVWRDDGTLDLWHGSRRRSRSLLPQRGAWTTIFLRKTKRHTSRDPIVAALYFLR